jgi:predicted RNA-binding Zn-ribbon protein involved in translation (DUF1610 family)
MMAFLKVEGPACPTCGCLASAIIKRATRWGAPSTRRQCDHCGRVFSYMDPGDETNGAEDPTTPSPVIYQVVKCPVCDSSHTRVTSTRRPLRHHKCDDCGAGFKSHEL